MPPIEDRTVCEWTDEQLKSTASAVYCELPYVSFEEVAEAARHCSHLVPASAGVPGLRHGVRRLALGLEFPEERPRHLARSG